MLSVAVGAGALEVSTGAGLSLSLGWRYVPGGVTRGPVLAGPAGAVYFLADDWYLYRVNKDGTLAFRFDLGAAPEPALASGPNGSVIAATSDGTVVEVDPDGRSVWRWHASGGARATALVSDPSGCLFAAVSDRRIVYLNMSGELLWSLEFDSGVMSMTSTPDGGILCNDASGRLFRLDQWGGVRWSVLLDAAAEAVTIDDATGSVQVLLPGKDLVWIDSSGTVIRRTRLTADIVRREAPSIPSVLTGRDGTIYALPGDGGIYAYAPDGARRFVALPPDGQFTGCAPIPSGGVLAVTSNGLVLVLDAAGAVRLSVRTPEPTSLGQPWLTGSNQIVAGGTNWVAYSFELRGGVFATKQPESNGRPDWEIPRLESFQDIPDYISLQSRLSGSDSVAREDALNELIARVVEHHLRRSLPYVTYLLGQIVSNRFGSMRAANPADAGSAAIALGKIGTPWARALLLAAARAETDSTVVASLVRALALCGPDWDGEVQRTLDRLLRAGEFESDAPLVREAIASALARLRLDAGRVTQAGVDALSRLQSMAGNPER